MLTPSPLASSASLWISTTITFGRGLFGPKVMVVEIHKLADEASGDGVSIALAELGGSNLVFVDEGHKGVGSDAQTWKNRQKALSAGG